MLVVAFALFILSFVVVAAVGTMLQNGGLGNEPGDPSSDPNSNNAPEAPSNAPSLDQLDDITLSGSGDTVTDMFELSSGVAVFHLTYSGPANFAVTLYSAAGEYVDLLANEIDAYSGSSLVGVSGELMGASEGEHYLEITASGPWNIVVEQPRASSSTPVPVTLSGKGDDVPAPFSISSGSVKFTLTHQRGFRTSPSSSYDADGRLRRPPRQRDRHVPRQRVGQRRKQHVRRFAGHALP